MLKDELVIQGRFEWFRDNDKENIQKHGFSFEQILDVFDDPYFYEIYDSDHSDVTQDRYFGLGCTNSVAIMTINYAENNRVHLISARLASPKEIKVYDAYCRKING